MLRSPSGEPVPRVLTAGGARVLGFSYSNVRTELGHERWQVLMPGIYLTRPDPPDRADWIRAGLSIAGPEGVLSGWDAVRAHWLGDGTPPVDEVLILCRTGGFRTVGQVRIRPSMRPLGSAHQVVPGAGWINVANCARAVADTSLVYRRLPPVRALVTGAVQAQRCSLADLEQELADGPQQGSAHLRRAIADVRAGAASISEAELADLMRAAGLPEFEQNVPIVNEAGRHIATADVLWRGLRAVLEVDSKRHHFLEADWARTMRRHNRLMRCGLAIAHYPPAEFRGDPHRVTAEIDLWLRARATELGLAYPPSSVTTCGGPLTITAP
jgi:very-short-patch-repair endonuclease